MRIILFFTILFIFQNRALGQHFILKNYDVENELITNTFYGTKNLKGGEILLCTNKGLIEYENGTFMPYIFVNNNNKFTDEVFNIFEDSKNRIWLYTLKGKPTYIKNRILYTSENDTTLKSIPSIPVINHIKEDSFGNIYFSSFSSKFIYKYNNINCQKVNNSNETSELELNYYSIEPNTIRYFYLSGLVVTDNSNGKQINKIQENADQFIYNHQQLFKIKYGSNYLVINNDTINLIEDCPNLKSINNLNYIGNNLFICHHNGLIIYNKTNKTVTKLFSGLKITDVIALNQNQTIVTSHDNGIYILGNYNKKILELNNEPEVYDMVSNENNIFVLLKNNALIQLDKQLSNFKKINTTISKSNNYELTYCKKNNGSLVFFNNEIKLELGNPETKHTIEKVNARSKKVIAYNNEEVILNISKIGALNKNSKIKYIHHERMFDIINQGDSLLFFTSNKGLHKFANNKATLVDSTLNIFEMIKSKHHYFLISSMSNIFYTNDILSFKNYKRLKLPIEYSSIDKLFKINDSTLFVCTQKYNLVIIDHQKEIQKIYLPKYIVEKFPIGILSIDSFLYIGYKHSISKIPYSLIFSNFKTPNIINAMVVSDKIIDKQSIKIDNTAKVCQIYFDISNPDLTPLNMYYWYNNKWNKTTEKIISLNNLIPGENNLKIQLRNLDEKIMATKEVKFYVTIPLYKTNYFTGLCSLLALGVLFYGTRAYAKRQNKLKLQKEKLKFTALQNELKAMNAMMNPHFVFNTLTNLQSLYELGDKFQAKNYLIKFSELVRKNMAHINSEMISLEAEMDLVLSYLEIENMRFDNQLIYTLNIDEQVDTFDIQIPPLLIQPIVENCIKHGLFKTKSFNNRICIDILEFGNNCKLIIKNNGVLTNPSLGTHQGSQFAIKNIKERIFHLNNLNNTNMSIESKIDGDWYIVEIIL